MWVIDTWSWFSPGLMCSPDIREPINARCGKSNPRRYDSSPTTWPHLRNGSQSKDRQKRNKRRGLEQGGLLVSLDGKRAVKLQINHTFHAEAKWVLFGNMFPRNLREAEMRPHPTSREPTQWVCPISLILLEIRLGMYNTNPTNQKLVENC